MEYLDQLDKWFLSLTALQALGVAAAIVLFIVCLVLFFIWLFSPKPRGAQYWVYATVEEKTYAPSRSSSGSGVGVTSGGQVGTVATSSYTPQSFNVVFITDNKDVIVANDKKAYGHLNIGQKVKIWLQPMRYFGKEKEPEYKAFEVIN